MSHGVFSMRAFEVIIIAAIIASPVFGQERYRPAPGEGRRPVVGLTLSGGSARGLAHIGVLKVLEEEGVHIDLVSGNSMGSLLGALYALGYTPAQLEEIAIETDWISLFNNKVDRKDVSIDDKERMERYTFNLVIDGFSVKPLPGLLSGRKVHAMLSRLTWPANFIEDFSKMPRPFVCIATDINTGEAVILDKGSLADATRASMAIPGVFDPIEIDGRMLVDGMLVRNFPGEDARNMGAEILIGSDVGSDLTYQDSMNSLFDIINQAVILGDLAERHKQLAFCDILILPGVGDIGSFSFGSAKEIIGRGEESAREHIEEIRALAEYLSAWEAEPVVADIDLERPMKICGARVDSEDEIDLDGVLKFAGIEPPCDVNVDQLESVIDKLYGLGSYSLVRYRFEGDSDCSTLVFTINRDTRDYLYTGIRYDTTWRTSLLLNFSLRDFLSSHSDLEVDLLFSRRIRVNTQYELEAGTRNRLGLRAEFDFISDWLDVYDRDHIIARMDIGNIRTGLFAEYAFSRFILWNFGMMAEWCQTSPQIAPPGLEKEWARLNLLVTNILFDNLDRSWFPTRGIQLRLRGEYGDFDDLNTDLFNRAFGKLIARLPLHRRASIGVRLLFGSSHGEGIPAHYRFYLGGVNSPFMFQDRRDINFYGYDHQELSGEHAFIAGLDFQLRFAKTFYLILHGNAGNAVDAWDELFKEESIVYGGGLTAGIATPAGPVELTAATSEWHDLIVFFGAGYRF